MAAGFTHSNLRPGQLLISLQIFLAGLAATSTEAQAQEAACSSGSFRGNRARTACRKNLGAAGLYLSAARSARIGRQTSSCQGDPSPCARLELGVRG